MLSKNVAYTREYKKYRKKLDYIFVNKYERNDEEIRYLPDGKHFIKSTYYYDDSHEITEYNISALKTEVFNDKLIKVAEFKNIDYHTDFFSYVKHSNGRGYLFFATDLYGFSVMDLSNYNMFHYIPEASFKGKKETFIWTNVLYCNKNNIIAVEGCYWACPTSIEFYDFSDPTSIPLDPIFTSYDMGGEVNIDTDITPLRWIEDGKILLKCSIGNNETEKTIDILSQKKNK